MTDHARPPIWVLATLLVGLAHAAGAVSVMMRTPSAEPPPAPPILLDLAPVDPAPQMADATSAPPPPPAELPTPEPQPEPQPEPEPKPTPEKKPDPEPEPLPEPPPDAVIESPVPPPRPTAPTPRPARPKSRQTAPATDPGPVASATPDAAGPPAPAPAPPAAPTADVMAHWASRLAAHLERFKQYPEEARRNRRQGVAQIRFTLASDGRVLSVSVHRSTGSEVLDQEAIAWLHRASPLPIPPDGTPPNIALVVPMAFQLR